MNHTIEGWLRQAAHMTRDGRLTEATQAIQRALRGLPAGGLAAEPTPAPDPMVIDMPSSPLPPEPPQRSQAQAGTGSAVGRFIAGAHSHGSRTLGYKLYVPPGHEGKSLPLVVMLHGCTQDPDDFARGTGMNERALAQGFFVLYPAQAQEANPQRCWNWFKHSHQARGRGEPAVIADMTQSIIQAHGIDPRRVYIAGLSAGGAMAAIVAAAYPELYAAVGVHSGLPIGAASSMPEAFAAMKGSGKADLPAGGAHAVPTIVFHGDRDQTVHPRNGEQVIEAATRVLASAGSPKPRTEQGSVPQGRRYTRAVHEGQPGGGGASAEHWLVHGAGHAWSGGHPQGSYTDASGPDATGEMLRFFFAHPKPGGH